MSRDRTQEVLNRIGMLADEPSSELGIAEIREFLGNRSNHIIARAATVAGDWKADTLVSELEQAYERFMYAQGKPDPGCAAKRAIVEALTALDYAKADIFLSGIKHVQMEPVYGGREDTAPTLRASCARALATMNHPEALLLLGGLLMDPEPEARRGAITIFEWLGTRESELALRMKALSSEPEPDIIGGCLLALLRISPDRSFDFVAEFLQRNDEVSEHAALALGESHIPEAFGCLQTAWESAFEASAREGLLLALALHRSDEAFDFLLTILAEEPVRVVFKALEVLAIFRADAARSECIREQLEERGELVLLRAFEDYFRNE